MKRWNETTRISRGCPWLRNLPRGSSLARSRLAPTFEGKNIAIDRQHRRSSRAGIDMAGLCCSSLVGRPSSVAPSFSSYPAPKDLCSPDTRLVVLCAATNRSLPLDCRSSIQPNVCGPTRDTLCEMLVPIPISNFTLCICFLFSFSPYVLICYLKVDELNRHKDLIFFFKLLKNK